jgi:hypothetical protein
MAVKVVLCVVAVLAVYGALNSFETSAEYAKQYPDAYGGERAKDRFRAEYEKVPVTAELGYFTDIDPSQPAYASAFLAAQYAGAPRLLVFVDGAHRPELAMGNFSRPGDFVEAGESRGYGVVQDFGNGVVLYKRK